MGKTLNQIIKDTACQRKAGYNDTPPQDYYENGFVQGAEWFCKNHEYHQLRMWEIKVFDDHDTGHEPRTYTVPATSGRDAQLMAFILDRGIEDDKYGCGSMIEHGELELARMHTEILSSSATQLP